MKKDYIRQVKNELSLSSKQKKEIIRDLEEAFASALEHGETELQVVERLGSPDDFAANIHEQLGVRPVIGRKKKRLLQATAAAALSALLFSLSLLIKAARAPHNVIGQADAMTAIRVEGAVADPAMLLALAGGAALAVFVVLAVRSVRKK